MNGTAARFFRLAVSLAGLVVLGWVLTGQAAKPVKHRVSLPTDWSHRHLIFSSPATPEQYALLSQDPRYWQQVYRRQARVLPLANATHEGLFATVFRGKSLLKDWAVNLGSGASAGAGNYPAKFGFDVKKADCVNDYVIFSTGLPSSAGQASIVAFNNLYSGCGGTVPNTYWAYDTTGSAPGTVKTSPIMSLDGTQVAFVQTDGVGHGTVVLLKWAANNGSIGTPASAGLGSATAYASCPTPPCMAQFGLRTRGGTQTDDTVSSIYVDYSGDIAWVGDSQGLLHKFHPFFLGVPAEVRDATWPLQVHPLGALPMTSPVFEGLSNTVFLGDAGGFLYSVNATSGTITKSGQLDFGTGLVEGPIVDRNNQVVYVFSSSDGTAACTGGTACSAVYQLSTSFSAGATGSKVTVGNSVVFGSATNPNPMYYGGFDSAYYNSTNGTGNLYVCGNTGAGATLYQVPITAGVVPLTGSAISRLTTTTTSTAACSGVTDIVNPNTAGGPSERLFVSVQSDGRAANCGTGVGCVMSFVDAVWQPSTAYAVGQQVLNPRLHVETVMTAGTSGSTPPAWSATAGLQVNDGSVVWIDNGILRAFTLAGWLPNHSYPAANSRILDSNGNVEVSTTPGTSNAIQQPTWPTTPGATTPDGTIVWTNAGPVPNLAIPSAGGSSGIIEDNVVPASTMAGASQIYFTTLGDQTCGTSGTGGCAVQAAQPNLQ